MKSTEVGSVEVEPGTTLQKVGDYAETWRNGVRIVEYLTAVEAGKRTILELHMLGDLIPTP